MFIIGKIYNRATELHDVYGGNRQSGIAPCAKNPIIFLFTSPAGRLHGYEDGWISEKIYQYSGEGQFGQQEFVRGNKAIRDHEDKGRQLHLFKKVRIGVYEYLGEFKYISHTIKRGKDTDQQSRSIIVFQLEKVER